MSDIDLGKIAHARRRCAWGLKMIDAMQQALAAMTDRVRQVDEVLDDIEYQVRNEEDDE